MKRLLLTPPLAAALLMTTLTPTDGAGQERPRMRDRQTTSAFASPELRAIVEAERAFARRSLEVGWREAFLEYFADDAISFAPDPGNAKVRLRARPATPRPPPYSLDWWPVWAGISTAGDMGFTTGPSVGVDNTKPGSAPNYGYYFSVWKRQPDGTWKVAIDVGVQTPEIIDPPSARSRFRAAPPSRWATRRRESKPEKERQRRERERAELLKMERERFAGDDAEDVAGSYGERLAPGARLHRTGFAPFVGADAVLSHFYLRAARLAWQPAGADISDSGDLAYTYGAYELTLRGEGGAASGRVERGHYAHVWQRSERGDWLLLADVMHAAPAEKR
jgi:ketosteroid isomerase-like protein